MEWGIITVTTEGLLGTHQAEVTEPGPRCATLLKYEENSVIYSQGLYIPVEHKIQGHITSFGALLRLCKSTFRWDQDTGATSYWNMFHAEHFTASFTQLKDLFL